MGLNNDSKITLRARPLAVFAESICVTSPSALRKPSIFKPPVRNCSDSCSFLDCTSSESICRAAIPPRRLLILSASASTERPERAAAIAMPAMRCAGASPCTALAIVTASSAFVSVPPRRPAR